MTTLGGETVWSNSKYIARLRVSGDLSYGIAVLPREYPHGIGINVRRMADIPKVVKLIDKYGYNKAYDIWTKRIRGGNYNFGYLKGKRARKYLKHAYGDYAERLRKMKKR